MPTPTKTLSWAPSEEASKRALGFFTAGGALIGVVGFAVSFSSVMLAARPYLGLASWCVPVMVDLAIFVLTGLALFMELNDLGAKWIRLVPNGLSLWTLYLNTAEQHSWFGKSVHAVGPALWVTTVEIAAFAVRKLVGLTDEKRIEGLRRSLWLLRPLATWRIWRAMRVHQITTYEAALDRDAARAAVVGRLRLHHGRFWRHKAPLGERIALRLQGRDPAGVAAVLSDHADTVALLQAPTRTAEPVVDEALRPLDPVLFPRTERIVLGSFTGHADPFAALPKALTQSPVPALPANGPENEENAEQAAARLRAEGLSYAQIADRLGRSKSWAHTAVNGRQVEHANGSGRI
jgi:hypothetical protein